MNKTTGGEPINTSILKIGVRAGIMLTVVFIPMYLISINVPSMRLLPTICIIPVMVYLYYVIKLKRTEKEFFGILRKQNYKCLDCRIQINEMSENTWLLNNHVYCLRCGERHGR